MQTIRLPQGRVRVKTVHVGKTVKHRPEFQDCQAIAKKTGTPVQEVIERVMQAIRDRKSGRNPCRIRPTRHKTLARRDHG